MKNHKQLLMDFYLALLAIPEVGPTYNFINLKSEVLFCLAEMMNENADTLQRIFERMAQEDGR